MFTSPLESVQGIVGYAKAVNLRLEERSWVKLGLGAAEGSSSLPGQMEVWLDSPSFASSFNHLRWTSSGSVRFDAEIVENQENTTYANISMHDVPDFMELRLDNTSTDGTPKGYVRFSSSRPLALVEYNEYEVYGGNPADFTLMHARISGMPTSLTLTGTFDVARSTPPSISNPVGIGFIAKLLDNTMVRLSSKFYTIARTLRSIPDNLLHMPERAGWTSLDIPSDQHIGAVELWLASGPYIVRDGAFLAFYNLTLPPSGAPLMGVSFSARLEGIAGLQADFRRGNHIDLRTTVRQRFTAVFVDSNRDANASLEINPLPSRLVIDVDKDNRTLTLFTSDKVLSIEYLGWVGRQFLKVALSDLPTTVTVVQKANQFYINASEGQVVGAIDILSTNADLYVLEGNYLLVKSWAEGTSFGASLHGLGSVGYSTGPDGKLDLSLSSPDPLQIYIENESEELKARILINPLPSSISIGMSNLLGGGLKVPDIMNATSVFGFSSAVFAITDVGADVLNIASQVAGYVDEQMSGIGQNSTFSIRTASDTTLVGDIQKGNLTEAPWTHGITTRHIPAPVKGGSYYNTKLYLRLARETTLVSKNDGDRLNISIELRGFHPKYDWMLFDLRGMAGRDMFAYLTGIPSTVDLWLDANLTQNTTYGRELLRADLRFVASKPLGPFLASIARNPPVNSRVLLFASSLSPDLHIEAFLAERFELRYRATEEVRYLYIKTSRLVSEKWRSSTVLLHDIPRTVDVSMNPPTDFDAAAAPSHVLPEFSASADRDTLDIFVDFDGRASGQRSSFQIAIRDCGELITARRSGDTYRLRSSGSEEVYVKVREMPYRKEFSITALALYAENLHGLDLQISMVSGSYPIFRISDLGADSVHLGVRSRLSLGGDREGRLMLADCRSSGGIPSGIQLFSNGITSGSSTNDDHLIIPMPLASMLWTLFGG